MTHLRTSIFAICLLSNILFAALPAGAVLIVAEQQPTGYDFINNIPITYIKRFDETTLMPVPGSETTDPYLFVPSSMTVGPDGNIYVSSNFGQSIIRFNGQTMASMGVYTFFPGSAPGTLRFSPSGELYVADSANGNIHKFQGPGGATPGMYIGEALNTPISSNQAMSFAFDPSNSDLIVVNDPSPFVPVSEMYRVNSLGVATQIGSAGIGNLTSASSMLVGPSGELYVVDIFGNKVVRFDDLNGTNPTTFIDFTTPAPVASGSNYPIDILLRPDGNLLVSLAGQYNLGDPNPPEGALRIYSILNGAELPGGVFGLAPLSAMVYINNPAPEPSAGLLTLMGGVGLAIYRRRQRKVS